MTRINSAIPVQNLTDEHLLAEHREIKRLPYSLRKAVESGSIRRIPGEFCLGTGHVLFFLDKSKFTLDRYLEIRKECLRRGFSVEDFSANWSGIPAEYLGSYSPTIVEKNLLIDRISDRLRNSTKKSWHYFGKKVTVEEAIQKLKSR